MNTLLLDTVTWDLVLDVNSNIAVASEPYSLAQDASSECRLFQGEAWYDTTRGVPYWTSVLGKWPLPLQLVRAYYKQAAGLVPDVTTVSVFFDLFEDRKLSGQIQVTGPQGISAASF